MLKSRALTGALIVGAVAVASLFAASPASAATLPAGQKITVLNQFDDQFYTASPVDASLTAVGIPDTIAGCVEGVDVDDNGLGYAIASDVPFFSFESGCNGDEGALPAAVFPADANTGLLGAGVQVTLDLGLDGLRDADNCSAIDYTDGVVTAACMIIVSEEFAVTFVGTLDPATGLMQPDFAFDGGELPFLYVTAIATDPITGELYLFTVEAVPEGGFFFGIYTIDEVNGLDPITETRAPVWGADFDRGGQLWVSTQDGGPALATVALADGDFSFFEFYTLGGAEYQSWIEPLMVWGLPPTLPATGPANSTVLGVGAAVFLLVGAILAAATIARRRPVQG
jgi:hypothetical protein